MGPTLGCGEGFGGSVQAGNPCSCWSAGLWYKGDFAAEAQSFDRVAEDYYRLSDLDRRQLMEQWLVSVLPDCGQRALDVGCGPGRQAVTLADRFGRVDAIDLSGMMIELARARRARPNISYRQADLHELDPAVAYDFILSVLTLHHVRDLHAPLRHIKELVNPRRPGRAVGHLSRPTQGHPALAAAGERVR